MAIHLILLAVNTILTKLRGHAKFYSDCLGALGQVKELPPSQIPLQCRHLDILKSILVICSKLLFCREYLHIKTHQDDCTKWDDMTKEAQLNAACDAGTKICLQVQDITKPHKKSHFH